MCYSAGCKWKLIFHLAPCFRHLQSETLRWRFRYLCYDHYHLACVRILISRDKAERNTFDFSFKTKSFSSLPRISSDLRFNRFRQESLMKKNVSLRAKERCQLEAASKLCREQPASLNNCNTSYHTNNLHNSSLHNFIAENYWIFQQEKIVVSERWMHNMTII